MPDTFDDRGRELDEVNFRILTELERDARQSTASLARAVGLSAPAVADRVRQMEQRGVIAQFQVELNPAAFGCTTTAFVHVQAGQATARRIAEDAVEVSEYYDLVGRDAALLKIEVSSVADLARFSQRLEGAGLEVHASLVVPTSPQRKPTSRLWPGAGATPSRAEAHDGAEPD